MLLLVATAAQVSVASPIDQHQMDNEPAQDDPADQTTGSDVTSEDVKIEEEPQKEKEVNFIQHKRSPPAFEGVQAEPWDKIICKPEWEWWWRAYMPELTRTDNPAVAYGKPLGYFPLTRPNPFIELIKKLKEEQQKPASRYNVAFTP